MYKMYCTPSSQAMLSIKPWVKLKEWKNIYNANNKPKPKKTGRAILILDKIYFRTRSIIRDKKGHCIILKESVSKKITVLNVYEPCRRISKYMNQTLTNLKGNMKKSTIIVGDSNISLLVVVHRTRSQISVRI